jgi:hypothetical protein
VTAPTPKEPEVIAMLRNREWEYKWPVSHYSDAILAAYDALKGERDAAVQDAAIVREIRARRNVVVEVSPELLDADVWSDEPLHVLLAKNTDRAHLLTFRESDELRSLRARLAACEKIVEAAKRYTDSAPYEVAHYSNDANVAYNVLRVAVATAQGDTV